MAGSPKTTHLLFFLFLDTKEERQHTGGNNNKAKSNRTTQQQPTQEVVISRTEVINNCNMGRVSQEEQQYLTDTLVDPENLDNPDGQWTKGETQPTRCRDSWAAVLFYAQFIAIAVVAGVLGIPAVLKSTSDSNSNYQNTTSTVDYTGLLYGKSGWVSRLSLRLIEGFLYDIISHTLSIYYPLPNQYPIPSSHTHHQPP